MSPAQPGATSLVERDEDLVVVLLLALEQLRQRRGTAGGSHAGPRWIRRSTIRRSPTGGQAIRPPECPPHGGNLTLNAALSLKGAALGLNGAPPTSRLERASRARSPRPRPEKVLPQSVIPSVIPFVVRSRHGDRPLGETLARRSAPPKAGFGADDVPQNTGHPAKTLVKLSAKLSSPRKTRGKGKEEFLAPTSQGLNRLLGPHPVSQGRGTPPGPLRTECAPMRAKRAHPSILNRRGAPPAFHRQGVLRRTETDETGVQRTSPAAPQAASHPSCEVKLFSLPPQPP
jgi:hypothetical protein